MKVQYERSCMKVPDESIMKKAVMTNVMRGKRPFFVQPLDNRKEIGRNASEILSEEIGMMVMIRDRLKEVVLTTKSLKSLLSS